MSRPESPTPTTRPRRWQRASGTQQHRSWGSSPRVLAIQTLTSFRDSPVVDIGSSERPSPAARRASREVPAAAGVDTELPSCSESRGHCLTLGWGVAARPSTTGMLWRCDRTARTALGVPGRDRGSWRERCCGDSRRSVLDCPACRRRESSAPGIALKRTGTADCSKVMTRARCSCWVVKVTGGHSICVTDLGEVRSFFFDGHPGGGSSGDAVSQLGGIGTVKRRYVLVRISPAVR